MFKGIYDLLSLFGSVQMHNAGEKIKILRKRFLSIFFKDQEAPVN